MTDFRFVKIRSWHVIDFHTRGFDTWVTLCGRRVTTLDVREALPAAKSCESCARIALRKADAPIEDDGSTQPVETVP